MGNPIDTQGSIRRDVKLTLQAAIGIGLDTARIDLLTFGVINDNIKALTGISGSIGFVIFGLAHPQFKADLLPGAINGPVGHNKGFGLVVFAVVVVRIPDTGKTQVCQAIVGADGCQPMVITFDFGRV